MSEAEVLGVIMRDQDPINNIMKVRKKSLSLVVGEFRGKDMKAAVEVAIAMDDKAVLVDLLTVINNKQ